MQETFSKVSKDVVATAKILNLHYQSAMRTGFTGTHPQDAETISEGVTSLENHDLLNAASALEANLSESAEMRTRLAFTLMDEVARVSRTLQRVLQTLLSHSPDLNSLYSSNLSRSSAISESTVSEILKSQVAAEKNVKRLVTQLDSEELADLVIRMAKPNESALELRMAVEQGKDQGQGRDQSKARSKKSKESESKESKPKDKGKKETSYTNLKFYAMVLQYLIDTQLHTPGLVARVMRRVEILKSQAIQAGEAPPREVEGLPTYQKLIQTYRLIPSEPSLPLTELLKKLFPNLRVSKEIQDPQKYLASISESQGVGFIVWSKLSYLEHRFRNLIDEDYLKASGAISPGEGVSEKYIAATETLISLTPKLKNDFFFSVGESPKFWILLETLDGEHFHYLRPWAGNGEENPQVPYHWFSALAVGAAKPGKAQLPASVPSPRVGNYNRILEGEILQHLRAPYVGLQQLTRDEAVREETYWKNLRNAIKKATLQDFRAIKGLKPENVLSKLKGHPTYYENLVRHIADQIEEGGKWPAETADLAQRELYLSGYQQLSKLRGGLAKALEAAYLEVSKTKKSETLERLWEAALDEALSRFINRKSSIYITLDNKSEVLRRTLG